MKQTILSNKLNTLSKFFDLEEISEKPVTTENISHYYKINKLAYWLFNSRKGYVHMGISRDGKYKRSDLEVVLNEINNYIENKKGFTVLELAAGKGANSYFLSNKNPHVQFFGLDLPVGQTDTAMNIATKVENFQMRQGDFHNLSLFEKESFDLVFIIEALCHSKNKELVANEVFKVLKPTGVFFIADGYLCEQKHTLTDDEILAQTLLAKGMMVGEFEQYEKVKESVFKSGFNIITEEDVTQYIIPTAQRFEKFTQIFLSLGFIAKFLLRIFPRDFSHNIVSGYLFSYLLRANLGAYYLSVFKRK